MENYAKLIHKSQMTYLPTNHPVQFFGLPDGKVYVIYARFYEIKYKRSDLEFVLAEHLEFSYNYEKGILVSHGKKDAKSPIYNEMVDKPDPKVKIIKVKRNLKSYAEAIAQLNIKAKNQFLKQPDKIKIIPKKDDQSHLSIA